MSLCSEHTTARGFTVDDIARWPVFRQRNIKRNSIDKALRRFVARGIAYSPGVNAKGQRLFKVRNSEWAMTYIQGGPEKPWLSLTPTPRPDGFLEYDEHRNYLPVRLTQEWFDRIQHKCELKSNQYTLRRETFTLSINGKSYSGQMFLRPGWQCEVQREMGYDIFQYLTDMESKGTMRGDFCLPLSVKGGRIMIGGRPTQFSTSHYQAQLDIRCAKNDPHIREGLLALTNQADFNTRVLDLQDAILQILTKQGDVQERTAEMLEKLVQVHLPGPDHVYQSSTGDKGEFAYQ